MALGNKEIFANNLKKYMAKYGIDRNKLCADLNFKYMTVSDWINAKTYPRIDKIEILASYFNIKKSDLVEEKSFHSSPLLDQITKKAAKLYPPRQKKVLTFTQDQLDEQEGRVKEILSYYDFTCYGAVSAGTGEWLGEEQKEKVSLPSSIVPHHPFDFVLRVNGDSMEPLFKNHEYVFVKKVDEVRSGQIGVFIVDGEAYLKKVYIEKDHLRLVSLNKAYDDLIFDNLNDIKVVGTVVL